MTSDEPTRPADEVPADAPSTAVGVPGAVGAPGAVGVPGAAGVPGAVGGPGTSGGSGAIGIHAEVGLPAAAVGVPVRRGMRVSRPPRHPRWLVDQLPVGMVQSDFFVRFVALFQEVASTLLDDADLVEHIPDVTVTPAPMLQSLASWIGVDVVDASLPEQLQRTIVASSSRSLAHRGTVRGLREFVEMLSGGPAEVLDGGGVWREGDAPQDVGWVRVTVAGTGHLSADEFAAMIRDEIPAHVRIEFWVGSRRVLSTMEEERHGH